MDASTGNSSNAHKRAASMGISPLRAEAAQDGQRRSALRPVTGNVVAQLFQDETVDTASASIDTLGTETVTLSGIESMMRRLLQESEIRQEAK